MAARTDSSWTTCRDSTDGTESVPSTLSAPPSMTVRTVRNGPIWPRRSGPRRWSRRAERTPFRRVGSRRSGPPRATRMARLPERVGTPFAVPAPYLTDSVSHDRKAPTASFVASTGRSTASRCPPLLPRVQSTVSATPSGASARTAPVRTVSRRPSGGWHPCSFVSAYWCAQPTRDRTADSAA